MKRTLDKQDIILLQNTQNGIELVDNPFKMIGNNIGLSEEDVISKLKKLIDEGVIRRFGASINNRKAGIIANAMVVWKIPESRVEEIGELFSKNEYVTHCYTRTIIPGRWAYNMFTVIHSQEHSTVVSIVKEMSNLVGIDDYNILFSTREFKKTSNGRIVEKIISKIIREDKK